MVSETQAAGRKIKPIREDFFTTPLEPPEQVRLSGQKCLDCGEVFIGRNVVCLNCMSENLNDISLSNNGTLYSYTVIRHRPPGGYKGPDNPFVPFAEGMIELPDGLLILAPLTRCDFDDLSSSMLEHPFLDSRATPQIEVGYIMRYRQLVEREP